MENLTCLSLFFRSWVSQDVISAKGPMVKHASRLERLRTWLEVRKKHCAAIHKLSLAECHSVTLDDVNKLRELVTHVTSDMDAHRFICDIDSSYSRYERGSDSDEEVYLVLNPTTTNMTVTRNGRTGLVQLQKVPVTLIASN